MFSCAPHFSDSGRSENGDSGGAIGCKCQSLLPDTLPRGRREPGLQPDGHLLASANKDGDDDDGEADDVVNHDG